MARFGRADILKLEEQNSQFLNSTLTAPKTKMKETTRDYVNSLHKNNRNKGVFLSLFKDQVIEFDNNFKIILLDSITVNKNATVDNEVSDKKVVDDSTGEGKKVKYNHLTKICKTN